MTKELRRRAQNIRMIATDLDGTLFDRNHEFTEENQRVLRELAQNGIIIVCATGRARTAIPESISAQDTFKYLIAANGAKVYVNETNEIIFEKYISEDAIEYIRPLLSDKEILAEVFWDDIPHVEEARYDCAPEYGIPFWFSEYFFKTRKAVRDFETSVFEHRDKIENINFVFPNDAVKARIGLFLEQKTDLYELTTSLEFNYEIGGIGVNKATALDLIAKREGIRPDEIMTFGDNNNDIKMIRYAGIGIAVANASQGALAAADYITGDNEQGGVAAALRTLGLI